MTREFWKDTIKPVIGRQTKACYVISSIHKANLDSSERQINYLSRGNDKNLQQTLINYTEQK